MFHPIRNYCEQYPCENKYSSRPTASLSSGRGDVVQSARVPLLYPCPYAREKLSVRESDHRSSPLLPSILNVFPSVEATTIVNVCIQFAGFEQNSTFRRSIVHSLAKPRPRLTQYSQTYHTTPKIHSVLLQQIKTVNNTR